jgi:hypothetical protein
MRMSASETLARIERRYCSLWTRYWVMTSKQNSLLGNRFLIRKYTQPLLGNDIETTKQHLLLGNRFLISKYMQLLLDNAFANTLPRKRLEYNNERC